MAANYFLGWSREKLETWRTAIQEARLTGRIVRAVTAPGIYTDFDPNKMDLAKLLDQIQYAISQLEDADPDDPMDADPYLNRPGVTQQVFG